MPEGNPQVHYTLEVWTDSEGRPHANITTATDLDACHQSSVKPNDAREILTCAMQVAFGDAINTIFKD